MTLVYENDKDGNVVFEHNINSATGMSGALLLVLDQNQARDVEAQAFGRTFAVHLGSSKLLGINLGFFLPKIDRMVS